MVDIAMYIDGAWVPARSGATFQRRCPMDGSVATTAPAAQLDDAMAAVQAAAAAFPAWSKVIPAERRALLYKAGQWLEANAQRIAQVMIAETGASAFWAAFNIRSGALLMYEAAAITSQIEGQVIPSNVENVLALATRQPAGVVLGIAPWNAPLSLGVRAVAVPLACGNTVVFKGSEACPGTHSLIAHALHEAGLPKGVINFITNDPADAGDLVAAMIAHPAVRRVNFTGSTRVGRIIAEHCAKHLKPSVLELGGKAPLLVLDDADLELAVASVAFGAFVNSGQICMSTERIIVDSAVADEFVARLVQRVQGIQCADARTTPAPLGSVFDVSTVKRANQLIDDALAKGATLVCGGRAQSVLMQPTLLDHVTADMAIFYEETFAPVKAIVRVNGEAAAIACANDSDYGLSAAVFTRDAGRGWRVAQQIASGMCHINGPTVQSEAQMPFGGIKDSGWGHFGGRAGIEAFTDLRWITSQTQPRKLPF